MATSTKSPFDHLYYGIYSNVHLVSMISSMMSSDAGQWSEQIKNLSIQPLLNYDTNRSILILDPETKKIESVYQIENFLNLSTILFQYGTLKDIHISAIIKFLLDNLPKVDNSIVNQINFKFFYYSPVKDLMKIPYTKFVKNTMITALGTKMNELTNEYVFKVKINSQREMIWISKNCSCSCCSSCSFSMMNPNVPHIQVIQQNPPPTFSVQSQTSPCPSLNTSSEITTNQSSFLNTSPIPIQSNFSSFPTNGFTSNQFGSNGSFTQNITPATVPATVPTTNVPSTCSTTSSVQQQVQQPVQQQNSSSTTSSWNQSYQNIFNKPLTEVFSTTISQPQSQQQGQGMSTNVNPFASSTTSKPNPFSTTCYKNNNPFSQYKSGNSFGDSNNVFGQKFSY
jgi:hypothetical protein